MTARTIKKKCYLETRGSSLYRDLSFLGMAHNYRYGNSIQVTHKNGIMSMVSTDGERFHRVNTDIKEKGIESGDYLLLYISMGEAIMLVSAGEWPGKTTVLKPREYDAWVEIEHHCYSKTLRVCIDDAGKSSGWEPYHDREYDYFSALMVKIGITIRFEHMKALRGRVWDMRYEDNTMPIVCTSDNRTVIIKPIKD
jgi:hypothetical protein